MKFELLMELVREERMRHLKWDDYYIKHFSHMLTLLIEELGEASKDFLCGNTKHMQGELVQCIAVLCSFVEGLMQDEEFG